MTFRPAARLLRWLAVPAALAAVTATSLAPVAADPPRPREKPAIEPFAAYQPEFFCRSGVEPGVKAFERMVLKAYPATGSDGDMRSCAVSGTSEHKDGRAWDWGADHRVTKQRKAGKALLTWLFASDRAGNSDAMVRRLGIMYIIWNKRIWGAWDQRWAPYSCSGPTLCHVNHMHFSFGWAGAEKKTSYWTHRVAGTVEPPLPGFGSRHHHRTLSVTARSGSRYAHWLLAGGATYRVTATGVWHHGSHRTAAADAWCTRTSHGWVPSSAPMTVGGDQLGSWGEHWVATTDTGGGCNTATHSYRLMLAPQSSTTVEVQLPDGSRSDDSGAVRLRFTRTG